jgi:hypothetical protein
MNRVRSIFTFFSLVILVGSCVKDTIDLNKISNTVNWDLAYATPVAYGSITMTDILEQFDSTSVISIGSDSLLHLVYTKNLLSEDANEVMQVPYQEFSQTFKNDLGLFTTVGDSIKYTQTINFSFGPGNSEAIIDSVIFKSGTLSVETNSTFPNGGTIKLIFNTLTKNGKPLVNKIALTPGNQTNYQPNSLEGYKLELQKNATDSNQVPVTFEIAMGASSLSGSEEIGTIIKFNMAKFKLIYGYLGTINLINSNGTNTIKLFENKNNQNIQIANPLVSLYIKNTFGLPVSLLMSDAYTQSDVNGRMDVTFDHSVNPISVAGASIKTPYVANTDTTVITKSTSNIFDAIATVPQSFTYLLSGKTNPNGNTNTTNFMTDSSKLDVTVGVELPLELKAGSLVLDDTISFDLSDVISDFSILQRLAIYSKFENGMPFDLKLKVTLVDSLYNEIDQLYTDGNQPILSSGILDASGKVTQTTTKTTQTIFEADDAKKLENVRYAIISSSIATAGNGSIYVKLLSGYKTKVSFQVQTELKVTSLNQF